MTDPADPNPAPADPDGDPVLFERAPDLEPEASWDRHRELLALLLVVAAIGQILQALLTAYADAKPTLGSGRGFSWSLFLQVASTGGAISTALLVVAALVVAVGSGRRESGRLGELAIQLVSVVGVVSAALALLAIEEYQRQRSGATSATTPFGERPAYGWMEAALAAHMLPAAALAGTAAYVAWRRVSTGTVDGIDDLDPA